MNPGPARPTRLPWVKVSLTALVWSGTGLAGWVFLVWYQALELRRVPSASELGAILAVGAGFGFSSGACSLPASLALWSWPPEGRLVGLRGAVVGLLSVLFCYVSALVAMAVHARFSEQEALVAGRAGHFVFVVLAAAGFLAGLLSAGSWRDPSIREAPAWVGGATFGVAALMGIVVYATFALLT